MKLRIPAALVLACAGLFTGCIVEGAPYFAREAPPQRFPDMATCEREAHAEEPGDRDRTYPGGYVCRRKLAGVLSIEERRWWLGERVGGDS